MCYISVLRSQKIFASIIGRSLPRFREDPVGFCQTARDGLAANRLPRRANALVLLDDGMSYAAVARVLLLDDDTVRAWRLL